MFPGHLAKSITAGLVTALVSVQLSARTEILAGLDFGQLRVREVRVYLPPGEVSPGTPVLLVLDGQNMAAWRLEEALAALAAQGRKEVPLVVAIASGEDRIEEYGMAGTLDYAGRGKLAADFQRFVLDRVLPTVRLRYGVKAEPARTGIMGSSLGGLAAFDLAWRHPEAFGFAGLFSGSFWWRGGDGSAAVRQASRLAHQLVRTAPVRRRTQRFWFSAGTHEEKGDRDGNGVIDAVQDTTELVDALERHGLQRGDALTYLQVDEGEHNETSWARVLPSFLEWALPPR